jgi:hypothetical protein
MPPSLMSPGENHGSTASTPPGRRCRRVGNVANDDPELIRPVA